MQYFIDLTHKLPLIKDECTDIILSKSLALLPYHVDATGSTLVADNGAARSVGAPYRGMGYPKVCSVHQSVRN